MHVPLATDVPRNSLFLPWLHVFVMLYPDQRCDVVSLLCLAFMPPGPTLCPSDSLLWMLAVLALCAVASLGS